MNKDFIEINVGPLSSFNSLTLYLGPQLDKLRNDYIIGKQTIPIWNLRNISPKGVSIAALVGFLSISKKIRDFIGEPIRIHSYWQPEFQAFLSDIGFVQIAEIFDLYDWNGMLGGYNTGKTNPNTKIFFYSDFPRPFQNQKELIQWKDLKRQEIKHSMLLRLSNIFDSDILNNKWGNNLEGVLTITGAELIVNSLLHGQDIAFVAVQRSSSRISTSICDAGIGFPKSMKASHNSIPDKTLTHAKALLIASVLSKNKIGLYRAIDDVINTGGYVVLSSFNAEIRWENEIWEKAKYALEEKGLNNIDLTDIGNPIEGYVDKGLIESGYYKQYPSFLIGSRITFEIPLKNGY